MMDSKTKNAITIIIKRYKKWLRLYGNEFKGEFQEHFGNRTECPLCDLHLISKTDNVWNCEKCPAKIDIIIKCYNQEWFRILNSMRYRGFDSKIVRKALRERIVYYENKLKG